MTTPLIGAQLTVARARQESQWFPGGFCLNFVAQMATGGRGLGVYAPTAKHAWDNAEKRHKRGTPPPGSFVFWRSPDNWHHDFGHVAVSVGGGRIRSTGIGARTDVGETTIANLTRSWGYPYLGWSEDLYGSVQPGLENGTRIPGFAGSEEPDVTTDDSVRNIVREELARAMRPEATDDRVRRIVREELAQAMRVELTDAQMAFIGTKARKWSFAKAIGYVAGQSALSRKRTGTLVHATDDIGEDLDAIKDKVNG